MNEITDNESVRAELVALSASGDLLDLARHLRELGVESLLFARPDGRIERVVTDRQIAHLATWHSAVTFIPARHRAEEQRSNSLPVPFPVQATALTETSRSTEGERVRSQTG